MNISEINSSILSGSFTNDELTSIIDAVKFARANLSKQIKHSVRVGTTVKFTSSRNGMTYTGKVEKVKIKYVLVSTPNGRYNVPANMLEVA
jgi:hypothetical protein